MRLLLPFRFACRLPILIGVLLIVAGGPCLAQSARQLKSPSGRIKHVISVQFDNADFLRDNPNVPSDLEQMPRLLNFIEDNGVLMANDHTALISHTATGILTSLTGVYPDLKGSRVHGAGERTAGRSKPLAAPAWRSGGDVRSRHARRA